LQFLGFYWLERGIIERGGFAPSQYFSPQIINETKLFGVFKRGANPSKSTGAFKRGETPLSFLPPLQKNIQESSQKVRLERWIKGVRLRRGEARK
jgi:hypothetical protein